MTRPRILLAPLLLVVAFAASCIDNPTPYDLASAPAVQKGTRPNFTIVVPADASAGLRGAATDLADAAARVGGGEGAAVVDALSEATTKTVVVARILEAESPDQSYRIRVEPFAGERGGLLIEASSDVGAMYGLYHVIADLGVRYHHPEESFFPAEDSTATLPWYAEEVVESPRFELRGFHEHTQHPIPMSDFYLRPEPEFRGYVSNYLRWLARNRQNAASWHMLKTVDIDAWSPYVEDIIAEAHEYGIEMGMVLSYVDEQQNNFKIISAPDVDDHVQVGEVLRRFHALGFDFFTFQIGSSEFTKPADDALIGWLDESARVARELEPQPRLFTWIHITCDLEAEDGSNFWHLPARADTDIAAWVHTVMFHDLEHPAPVYGCENFHHQRDFLNAEAGNREMVYFPESAWWLGFDNNTPIGLPITGYTRAHDIQVELAGKDILGHITFTSGREWTYWQYDHYLTRATWDDSVGWEDYLTWIAPMFGPHADVAVEALGAWTELQRKNFFDDNPLIYFYVAGELKQDEVGAQAGILARRPKRSYREIIGYDAAAFAAWKESEFDLLVGMKDDYAAIRDTLEAPSLPDAADRSAVLYYELYTTLDVFVRRIEHTVALYEGVIEVRNWVQAVEGGAIEGDARHIELLDAAKAKLDEARSISGAAGEVIQGSAAFYRYPDEILIEEKPESLTSYPFGYLEQAHTAHFWTRRDDQLESLIDRTFFERADMWERVPDVLYFAEGDAVVLDEPNNPVASNAIARFVPRLLFGLSGTLENAATDVELTIGQDYNGDFTPDPDSEVTLAVDTSASPWRANTDVYTVIARNDVGEPVGDGLSIFDAEFTMDMTDSDGSLVLETGGIDGFVSKSNLIALVVDVGGIDAAGVEGLLKAIYGIPRDQSLPNLLPFRFALTFTPAP